ncbi:MAG: DNRLRE domain-containing protein, partial [Bacteroidota bacterium]|nr:DNRLRE domain-containing protein [Bacteroidota bacterium]
SDYSIILQPDSVTGKDALLHGLSSEVNRNYGRNGQLASDSWTFGGEVAILRSVLAFDLSTIPENAVITSAKLSLHSWDSTDHSLGLHWNSDGSNASWLERVTTNWDQNTVTWNNQPSTTELNRVSLPETTSSTENYLDVDVTQLVQDMVANPSSSFGFMLKLQAEDGYRRMNFCSSDHPNKAYHPKLEIAYTLTTKINEIKANDLQAFIYPNPTKDYLTVKLTNIDSMSHLKLVLTNMLGQIIKQITLSGENTIVNLENVDPGIYIYQLRDDLQLLKLDKIIIKE